MTILYSLWLYSRATLFLLVAGLLMLLITIFLPSKIYTFAQFISIGMFKCFNIQRKIIGEFPTNGPYILMHNHSSFLDLFFLPTVIKGQYTGLVAAKNFKIPLIGSILRRLHAIPIYRFNHTKALDAIKVAEKKIQKGYHIAIFPEGTRTIDGRLNPFKKGGFHMAINTNTKILPVIVKGLYQIKPKNRWAIHPGVATMIIPEEPINVTGKSVDELIEETRAIYLDHSL